MYLVVTVSSNLLARDLADNSSDTLHCDLQVHDLELQVKRAYAQLQKQPTVILKQYVYLPFGATFTSPSTVS